MKQLRAALMTSAVLGLTAPLHGQSPAAPAPFPVAPPSTLAPNAKAPIAPPAAVPKEDPKSVLPPASPAAPSQPANAGLNPNLLAAGDDRSLGSQSSISLFGDVGGAVSLIVARLARYQVFVANLELSRRPHLPDAPHQRLRQLDDEAPAPQRRHRLAQAALDAREIHAS